LLDSREEGERGKRERGRGQEAAEAEERRSKIRRHSYFLLAVYL